MLLQKGWAHTPAINPSSPREVQQPKRGKETLGSRARREGSAPEQGTAHAAPGALAVGSRGRPAGHRHPRHCGHDEAREFELKIAMFNK